MRTTVTYFSLAMLFLSSPLPAAAPPASACDPKLACLDRDLGASLLLHPGSATEQRPIRAMTNPRNFITFMDVPIKTDAALNTCKPDPDIVLQDGDLMRIVPDGTGKFVFTISAPDTSTPKLTILMQGHVDATSGEFDYLSSIGSPDIGIEYAVYLQDSKPPKAASINKMYFLESFGKVECTQDRPEQPGNIVKNEGKVIAPKIDKIEQGPSGPGGEPGGKK